MKKNLLKRLSALVFALAMVLSSGVAISNLRDKNEPQIVLAEDEEKPETDSSESEEKEEEAAPESEPSTETPSETPAESTSTGNQEATPKTASSVEPIDIFKLIAKAFRDALKDLFAHFKRWFNR